MKHRRNWLERKLDEYNHTMELIRTVLPEAVELAPLDSKIDENGNKVSITGENYLTVFEEKIVPLLIESIKEQQTQIEALQSEINLLKGE